MQGYYNTPEGLDTWFLFQFGEGSGMVIIHQCTSCPFCPLDGLRFFIRCRMGLITVDFFLLLTTVLFFSFFVLGRFSWT
jgi:hypothetical protein